MLDSYKFMPLTNLGTLQQEDEEKGITQGAKLLVEMLKEGCH